jgi:cyclomaltodextrinase / maltogenic alpha-amylase / neopullulanase
LNPFHPDETYHGYHLTDYFGVNPRLGTLDDIRQLVARAHELGLRLILDFVPNHCGSGHPHFQDAVSRPDSPYRDWFYFHEWPHDYEMYYRVRDLPKINVDCTEARAHLVDSACYWLGEIGFDALRLDHAHGPSLDFWADLRLAVEKVKPDVWLVGEVTLPSPQQLVYEGRLHGCLDFLLAEALRRTFAFGSMTLAHFDAFLEQHEAFFPPHFSRPSFLDNHDMDRFLFAAGGDRRKLKLAALCQFTLSGQPIVYYGTEVGVPQERFINRPGGRGMAEARQPMLWGDEQDAGLRDFYRWLINFRRRHPALWRGRRQTVHLDRKNGAYAYLRDDGRERILAVFNLDERAQRIEVEGQSLDLEPWQGDLKVIA